MADIPVRVFRISAEEPGKPAENHRNRPPEDPSQPTEDLQNPPPPPPPRRTPESNVAWGTLGWSLESGRSRRGRLLAFFLAKLGPETPPDRRGSFYSAGCTNNQPRRSVLRRVRGRVLVLPDSRLHAKVWQVGVPGHPPGGTGKPPKSIGIVPRRAPDRWMLSEPTTAVGDRTGRPLRVIPTSSSSSPPFPSHARLVRVPAPQRDGSSRTCNMLEHY
jgi:hypothetical protein